MLFYVISFVPMYIMLLLTYSVIDVIVCCHAFMHESVNMNSLKISYLQRTPANLHGSG